MSTAPTSQRAKFHDFCSAFVKARSGGGTVTSQGARLLLVYVKKYMAKLPARKRNLEDVTLTILQRYPEHRIDLNVLEKYELVDRNPLYATSATGDEFKYRRILAEAFLTGEPKVLVDWDPTWEPVANIPKPQMKAFRDKNRK
ncbi:hypothetical protein BBJ28_00004773 [Nothophytophthora sp. Chile5]|nr:hypothetical protein BBJ28_00004773 [Nothophytophthora sp. Chile5]